jgi:hypothetical protein
MSKGFKALIAILLVGTGYLIFLYFAIAYRLPVNKTTSYQYDVTDAVLHRAVMTVIGHDSTVYVPPFSDSTGSRSYYNDSDQFISMTINIGDNKVYHYTLMYYGDSTYRSTASVSELVIHDCSDPANPNPVTSGYFVAGKLDTALTNAFEVHFIEPLDKELGMSHIRQVK